MKLRNRLALGLLAIAIVLLVPLLVALRSLQRLHDGAADLRDGEYAASLTLGRLRGALDDLRQSETALLFVHDTATRDTMLAHLGRVAALADSLDAHALGAAASRVRSEVSTIAEAAGAEFDAALAGRAAAAEAISTERVVPAIGRAERTLAAAEVALNERTRARVAAAADLTERAQVAAAVGLAVAVALALAIAVWLTRSVSRPVRALERGMRAMASGDFDHRLAIRPDRRDEFGRLAGSFRSMATELAELERLRAEFVSVASHELKTPINVILGYVQLISEGVFGELTPKQREVCQTLSTQAQSLGRLVKQLLDVSRFEAGAGKLDLRRLDPRRLLRDLECAFDVLARQRGITFEVDCADDLPAVVQWDADRMNEVLGNLLSNAFKFTPRGGRVALVATPLGDGLRIEVRDSGAGIPPDQLPHIFEKFYQADNQRAAAQKGTGLGLAIAKQIVDAHGGAIEVQSTPGVGTTFTLSMPAAAGAAAARRSAGAANGTRPSAGRAPVADAPAADAPPASAPAGAAG